MKSKLTLSIDKKTIAKAKELARQRNSTVSKMVADYIEETSQIEEKLKAKERITGIIDTDLAAEEKVQYTEEIHKKHGWE